jgi:hypothetical protein
MTPLSQLIDQAPVLCDEISDELGREMSRDSTDRRQLDRVRANGRAISRFRMFSGPVRTALRCDVPQVQRCYADRASPRPNSSWAIIAAPGRRL